jgi:hypothetical protein
VIKTVNFSTFTDAFRGGQYADNFSYDGLRLLFDYLEELEDETGDQIELDTCAICCDFSEYDKDELVNEFGDQLHLDEEELAELTEDEIVKQLVDKDIVDVVASKGRVFIVRNM